MSNKMDYEESSDTNKKRVYTVLHPRLGGGPHGLGDPDDLTLRKVEKDVLIPKKIRTISREEKCAPEVQVFLECCKETSLALVYKCRNENEVMKKCLAKWFYDEELIKFCTDEYLKERSEYRRTGLTKKEREKLQANK